MCDRSVSVPNWFRGRFVARWEVSSFEPCGESERWWTSFEAADGPAAQRLINNARPPGIDVELFGTVSEPGNYGHMGLYDREFRVQRIREVKPALAWEESQ